MNISLVSSINLGDWYNSGRENAIKNFPLGIGSLAAILEKSGHHIDIIDFNFDIGESTFKVGYDFFDICAGRIIEKNPDVIGFSTMCNSYHLTLGIAEKIREICPRIPIIFGGPQATIVDQETLKNFECVDFILRGEAEYSLLKLTEVLGKSGDLDGVPGLTYRSEGNIKRTPDGPMITNLDDLPIPAYHLFPAEIKYVVSIDAGRGCPYNCHFCSTAIFWKRRTRMKSVGRIIREMEFLVSEYQVKHFSFLHDMFTAKREWITDFCRSVSEKDIPATWSCSARPDCVDLELLTMMKDSGCISLYFGIETGSPRMQEKTGKNLDLSLSVANINTTIDLGMEVIASFIVGFPDETVDDLRLTLGYVQELAGLENIDIQTHMLAPVKETQYFDEFRHKLRNDGYFSDFVGPGLITLDYDLFVKHPDLFATFYYYENEAVPRDLLRFLDRFTTGFCAIMRKTLRDISKQDVELWDLYEKWRSWNERTGEGLDKLGVSFDLFVTRFYDFLYELAETGYIDFDAGQARDEILEFYFKHYHMIGVGYRDKTVTKS